MTDALDAAAQALYDARGYKSTPTWDQLGDVTRSVWRDRAIAELEQEFDMATLTLEEQERRAYADGDVHRAALLREAIEGAARQADKIEELGETIRDLEREKEDLEDELHEAERRAEKAEDEAAGLQAKVDDLTAELDELRSLA
jgi:chromosome segregation ATPase